VALLGTSGATGIFARWQPALGVVAVALAASALALRVRAVRRGTCRVPRRRAPTAPAHPNARERAAPVGRPGSPGFRAVGGLRPWTA
jgi:hypothetical protein